MCYIEILEIRVSQNHKMAFQKELDMMMKEIRDEGTVFTMQSYYRGSSGTDYLLVLHHKERLDDQRGSKIGQVLMDAFALYGMIHHSIWYEWNMVVNKI